MNLSALRRSFFVVFVGALFGCSSSGGGRGGDAQSLTVYERCDRIATAVCDRYVACNGTGTSGLTAADCATQFADQCCSGSMCVEADSHDPKQVALCEAQLKAMSCALLASQSSLPGSCEGLLDLETTYE